MANTAQSGGLLSPFHRFPVIIGNTRIPLFFKFVQNPNELTFTMEKEFQQTQTVGGYIFEHWGKKPTMMSGRVTIKKDSQISNLIGLNTDATNLGIEDAVFNPELTTLKTLFNIDQRKTNTFGKDGESNVFDTAQKYASKGATYTIAAAAALTNPYTIVSSGLGLAQTAINAGNNKVKFREPDPASIEGYASTLTDTIILYKGTIYSGFFTKMTYKEDGKNPFTNIVDFNFLVTYTTEDWLDTSLTQTAIGKGIAGIWGATTTATTLGSMLEDMFKDTGSDTHGHV